MTRPLHYGDVVEWDTPADEELEEDDDSEDLR
jgi:hypothetical protein